MLLDREGNTVELRNAENKHVLILGKSGSGKTWCCYRMLEEMANQKKSVYVFDYSGSYTQEELKRGHITCAEKISTIPSGKEKIEWVYRGKHAYSAFEDALIKALHIKSRRQKKLLHMVIAQMRQKHSEMTMSAVLEEIEMLEAIKSTEYMQESRTLEDILSFYEDLSVILKKQGDVERLQQDVPDKLITVVEFSDYGEFERQFLTEFFSEILWQEVKEGSNNVEYILYDEFQWMPIGAGSTLSEMLREGRKRGIGVWLASQFLSGCSAEKMDTLMQVNNFLFFKPAKSSENVIAKLIGKESSKKWQGVLSKLKVGECVVSGYFAVNHKSKSLEGALACRVVSENQK